MSGFDLTDVDQPAASGGSGAASPTMVAVPVDSVGTQPASKIWGYTLRNEHASEAGAVYVLDDAGDPALNVNLAAGQSADVTYPVGRPTGGSIDISITGGTVTGSVYVEA